MIRKTFSQRVKNALIRDGWHIKYTAAPLIGFLSVRAHTHTRKGYCLRPHEHLTQKERKSLYKYGKQTDMHILFVHEIADHELEFIRIYPRNEIQHLHSGCRNEKK